MKSNSKVWGVLTSIDLHSCDREIIRDAKKIGQYVKELCKIINMKRFGRTRIVHFGRERLVSGFSMTQLIETSLISGHFANASNSAYIDIFSCKEYDTKAAAKFTKKFFKAKTMKVNVLLRK